MKISTTSWSYSDLRDLASRGFFSLIFFGLGAEHLTQSALLQTLMPTWVPYPAIVSVACGLWLILWGSFVLAGYRVRLASVALLLFIVGVTLLVHLPGVLVTPVQVSASCEGLWQILQRSNLGKNVCLIGMCLFLFDYNPGAISISAWLRRERLPEW